MGDSLCQLLSQVLGKSPQVSLTQVAPAELEVKTIPQPLKESTQKVTYKYFQIDDFDCQETGENEIDPEFVMKLDELREACGFPFVITSGYRSPKHSIEAKKAKPGTHAQGIAADIRTTSGQQRHKIIKAAMIMGFNGIGVAKSFVHVDTRDSSPVVWSY